MEQLDAVYNTFTNLEKNYAKSKKSRGEYLLDKFGGDISIGSFLILQALAQEEFTSAEDIEKLSRVREIFKAIDECKDSLGTLRTLDFTGNSVYTGIMDALTAAEISGTGMVATEQQSMWKNSRSPAHYSVRPTQVEFVPLMGSKYVKVYSEPMSILMGGLYGVNSRVGQVYERTLGNRVSQVKRPDFWRK